ncbi:MAG: TonB-dependent receptor [Bacteroidota bacterium]
MRFLLLLGVCWTLSTTIYAQILTITDLENGYPLEFVSVSCNEPSLVLLTDAAGNADITPLEGASTIEINLIGYKSITVSYSEIAENSYRLSLEANYFSLDEVVVSATRWRQRKSDVPARIVSIDPKQIKLQNPQTAADLLEHSGEVFVQKSQLGGGSPIIRGFSTNRLVYTVDGVRMNTAIFRSGNLQNVISLDPFALAGTEVFFGPGSIIYGSDAIGAVMSFQTLNPSLGTKEQPLVKGNANLRTASASEERTGHFDLAIGWKKWALLSSFSHHQFGDLRMGQNGPDDYLRPSYVVRQDSQDVMVNNPDPLVQTPTGYGQTNIMQKIRFQPNEHWSFDYGFHYSTTTNIPRYDRLVRLRDGRPRSAEWEYGPQIWSMHLLSAEHRQNTRLYDQWTLRLAFQQFEESRIDRDFQDPMRTTRTEEVDAWSLNWDFSKMLPRGIQLFYGLEGVLNDVRSLGMETNTLNQSIRPGPARYPLAQWTSYATYATAQIPLGEKVRMQAGVRYNQFALNADFSNNQDFFPFQDQTAELGRGAITGSVGWVWNPSEKSSVTFNVSTGFRAPNVDDIGKVFDSEPGAVVVPNPDLQAEYAYNGEVGYTHIVGDWLKVDISAYYTLLDNALVRRNFQLNGQDSIIYDGELSQVQAIQNAAQARVYGVQAGLQWKLPAGFKFSTQYNYQMGQEELDDGTISPSRHAAPAFGRSQISYRRDGLFLQLQVRYAAEVAFEDLPVGEASKPFLYAADVNGNPYAPAWYSLDWKALYALNETLSISAGVENLTDQRYRTYSSGLTAPGRNFILGVNASW